MSSPIERMHRWGATDAEVAAALPGDEFVSDAHNVSTRAITVDAPAAAVWPWLQQIDQQRGGFYSYRWLENIARCHMPKVHQLVPEWGDRRVGDDVWMTSPDQHNGEARLIVARVDHERSLVMVSPDVYESGEARTDLSGSWTFVLTPVDGTRCRFIVRSRYSKLKNVFDVIHFVMERKMMKTIAKLAATRARATLAVRPSS
jgi:hypothetical protein